MFVLNVVPHILLRTVASHLDPRSMVEGSHDLNRGGVIDNVGLRPKGERLMMILV